MSIFLNILIILTSALICVVFVPLLKKYAVAWGLVDEPSERRIHTTPIPRCGGIAIFLATHLTIGGFILFGNGSGDGQLSLWLELLIGSAILLIIGLLDDKYSLSAWVKLGGQLVIASLMFFFGYSFGSMLAYPLPLILDFLVTIFWFALLMNAFNLIDGMDGVCAGLGLIASLTVGIICLYLGNIFAAIVLLALAGSCLGFLKFNFNPATIFLGDGGSLFIGFILAAVSLEANVNKSTFVSILLPLMIMGIPIFDVLLAVLRRLGRRLLNKQLGKNKKSKVFGPDLDHLHHRLLQAGFSQKKVALILYGIAIIASISVLGSIFIDNYSLAFLLIGSLIILNIIFRKIVHIETWTFLQWILKSIRRPIGFRRKCIHMGHDLLMLSSISILINYWFQILDNPKSLLIVGGGVLIPFLIIISFENYKIIWSRARPWQFWKLNIELILAEFLYFLVMTYMIGLKEINLLHFHVTRLTLLSGAIVIARLTPFVARDASSWLRRYQTNEMHFKTLIIGSGYELGAYLRRAAYRNSHIITRRIIGILENDPSLANAIVFGFPVLGEYKDFKNILDNNDITEIIVCDPEFYKTNQKDLKKAKEMNITIKRYISEVEKI